MKLPEIQFTVCSAKLWLVVMAATMAMNQREHQRREAQIERTKRWIDECAQ